MTWTRDRSAVSLVVTEHPAYLDPERTAGYEALRARLEEAGGRTVRSTHFTDVEALSAASAVVLSGAAAPSWAEYDGVGLERLAEAVRSYSGPVLGICAGMQLLAAFAGGSVAPMSARGGDPEVGYLPLEVLDGSDLLRGLPPAPTVFQDHREEVTEVPPGFRVVARTPGCEVQAIADAERGWWGTQFHPERTDDEHPDGRRVLANFFELVATP